MISSLPKKGRWQDYRWHIIFTSVVVLAASAAILLWQPWNVPVSHLVNMSELNLFWRPVLNDEPPDPVVLVCVERSTSQSGDLQKEMRFRIALANSLSAEDLQLGTAILVGGVNNRWTMSAIDGLRYHFVSLVGIDSNDQVRIEDRENPSQRNWTHAASTSGVVTDYALVARFIDSKTGRWRVVASGLDGIGTGVAARLLVDAQYTKEMTRNLPSGWIFKNIEVVIEVPVIKGNAGYPKMIAYEVW